MPRDPWWKSAVIYQIYPRSFQDTNNDGVGDLRGIVQRLPYLVELGVDAIWISPIFPSPMADFGYDVSNYIDIDPLFGTLADFDALVAAAHACGIEGPAGFRSQPHFRSTSLVCGKPQRTRQSAQGLVSLARPQSRRCGAKQLAL
jgi:hypothetical protein